MGTKKIRINSRRVYSEEFKKARVKEYESGKFTVNELSRLFKIQRPVIYQWIYKYSVYNKNDQSCGDERKWGKKAKRIRAADKGTGAGCWSKTAKYRLSRKVD